MKKINLLVTLLALLCFSNLAYSQCDNSIDNFEVTLNLTSVVVNNCDGETPIVDGTLEAAIVINGVTFTFGVPGSVDTGIFAGGNVINGTYPLSGANETCFGGSTSIVIGAAAAGTTTIPVTVTSWEEDGCGACSYGTGFFCNDDADLSGPNAYNVDITAAAGSFTQGCFTFNYEISCPPPPPACPELQMVTASADACVGDNVALTATVDSGVENVDYVIEWFEDGVAIPGANSAGPDAVPGTADDIVALTYMHAAPAGMPACGDQSRQYQAQLYCLRTQTIDFGDITSTSNSGGGVGTYSNYTQPITSYGVDLSIVDPCGIATSFDYGYAVASGGDYGSSYICEAITQVNSPLGVQGPFCHPDLVAAGNCEPYPTDMIDGTCAGAGAGAGVIQQPIVTQSLGGLNSTTPAQGNWAIEIFDEYDDNGIEPEGQINGVFLEVKYVLPPGCGDNAAATSIVNAAAPTLVCNSPVSGTDFTLPNAAMCVTDVTVVCAGGAVMYSGDNGVTYALAAAPTPTNGTTIYYEVTGACTAACPTTGSFVVMGCAECNDPCFAEYTPAATNNMACATAITGPMTACDDGDPCTAGDMEVLAADGTVCVPCTGTAVSPPIPSLTCPSAELSICDGTYDCMFADTNPATDGNGATDAPIVSGTAAFATSTAGVIDLTMLTVGASYTLTLNYEENGCLGTPITCTFTAVAPNAAEGGGF